MLVTIFFLLFVIHRLLIDFGCEITDIFNVIFRYACFPDILYHTTYLKGPQIS